MTKRIVFVTGSGDRDKWVWRIAQELNKSEIIIPHFIATIKKNVDVLCALGTRAEDITTIFALEGKSKPNLQYLEECERRYNLNIWDLWLVSAVRNKKRQTMSSNEIFSYVQYVFEKTEKLVASFKPEYYLCYGAAAFHAIIIREVFRQNGVKIIDLRPSVIRHRFSIFKDLSNLDPLLTAIYHQLKDKDIPEKERAGAEQFITQFRNKPLKPDCADKPKQSTISKIKKYSSYAFQLMKYRRLPPNLRFLFWPIIEKMYDSIGIYEKPLDYEKYILFPLHFQPESTTLIHGKWYVDQATLIENISKSAPISHKIYVKEHPAGYGNRHLRFYKRIKSLPNVRLISPHENTFDLIKKSSLIATITGTTGWEGLLFQKPIISFGNRFYNIFEGVKRVDKIEELPVIIRSKLDKTIDYEDLLRAVVSLFKSSYPGLARYPGSCNDQSLTDDNIRLLAKGIEGYIRNVEENKC